jgi:hypothetical protein
LDNDSRVLGDTDDPRLDTALVTDVGLANIPHTVTVAMTAGNSAKNVQKAAPAASIAMFVFDIW